MPAARFPELAKGVAAIASDPWATQLAKVGRAKADSDAFQAFSLRAVGLSDVPYAQTGEGENTDVRVREWKSHSANKPVVANDSDRA